MSAEANSPLVAGHHRALEQLEHTEAYRKTRTLYREALDGVEVYLRPTGSGFTVVSLDELAPKMIGVGKRSRDCTIPKLPPELGRVQQQAAAYPAKRAAASGSVEERYSLGLLRHALGGDLSLGSPGLYFIHQEWRFRESHTRIDILAARPSAGQLVVIELKDAETTARSKDSAKGGDAWEQAQAYARQLHEQREHFYPYFQRLGRALARAHGAPVEMRDLQLRADLEPQTLVGWPGAEFVGPG